MDARLKRFEELRAKKRELEQELADRRTRLRVAEERLARVRTGARERFGTDTREGLEALEGRLSRELDMLLPAAEEKLAEIEQALAGAQ